MSAEYPHLAQPGEVRNPTGIGGGNRKPRIFQSEVQRQLHEIARDEFTKHQMVVDNLIRTAMYSKNPVPAYIALRDEVDGPLAQKVELEAKVAVINVDI